MITFLFVATAASPAVVGIVIAMYAYAMVSDVLDGVLARHWRCTSRLGEALDLFGDKFLTIASALLAASAGIHLVACSLIVCREALLLSLRTVVVAGRPLVPPQRILGSLSIVPTRIGTLLLVLELRGAASLRPIVVACYWIAGILAAGTLHARLWSDRHRLFEALKT